MTAVADVASKGFPLKEALIKARAAYPKLSYTDEKRAQIAVIAGLELRDIIALEARGPLLSESVPVSVIFLPAEFACASVASTGGQPPCADAPPPGIFWNREGSTEH